MINLLKSEFLRKYFFKYLVYGNWGFPCWSGGVWVDDPNLTNWKVPPIDEMDRLFKQHDYYYQHYQTLIDFADINLIVGLKDIKLKGVYKNGYKIAAIIVFFIKLIYTVLSSKK